MGRFPPTIFLTICALLVFAGCSRSTGPGPTPSGTVAASPVRTAGVPVRRASAVGPPRVTATPALPQARPRDGVALVTQAVGLLLTYAVAPETSGVLYGAAYSGVVGTLRRAGYTVEPEAPAFINEPATDEAQFTVAYLRLAEAVGAEINQTSLAYETIHAVTDRLDECNTYLLEPPEYRQFRSGEQNSDSAYAGIGISLQSPATIGAVYPDTPAARAGLRPGDTIVMIAGQLVTALPLDQISALLRGPAGTAVQLTIQRPGEVGTRIFGVTRASVRPPDVTSELLAGPTGRPIGYLRLATITPGVEAEVGQALATFASAGVTGWVLDLRESGGTSPEALAAVASRFIAAGQPVAYRQRAGGDPEAIATAGRTFVAPARPLAVLINGGTTGMGEVLAAALRDHGLARLFGEATAGCTSISTAYPLSDGAGLRVGVVQLTSPQHRTLAGTGQAPDETILAGLPGIEDAVLEAGVRWAGK